MLTIVLIAVSLILLTGVALMVVGVRGAREGYEDASGFHLGKTPPTPVEIVPVALPTSVAASGLGKQRSAKRRWKPQPVSTDHPFPASNH